MFLYFSDFVIMFIVRKLFCFFYQTDVESSHEYDGWRDKSKWVNEAYIYHAVLLLLSILHCYS